VATLILTVSNTVASTTNVVRCSNQLPYNWNGTNYNASGTYTFATTNAAGCDSVATLVLTVSNIVTSTTNVVRCFNQLPYNWNGVNYNAGGIYTFTTTNIAGCDSIATLVLTINSTTTSTTNVTRCTNQLPYNWNGTNYNTAGVYTFTTVNAAGCDSMATLVLAINNTTTSTTNVTRCSNQLPYNWNGTNYNAAGTYTFSTINAAGCDSVATLVLTVSNTVTSTTTVVRCSNQLPYNWNGTNYNASGTYTFNTTNVAGCDSVATLVLTVSNTVTSTSNITLCPNQLPYNWNGVNYNSSGSYTFTTTNAAGCDSVATLVLTINNTTTSTTNVTRCSNQLPYLWNGTNYNAGGTYTFATTNASGCDSVATLVLTINNTTTSITSVTRCSNQLPYLWNGTNYNTGGTYTFTTTNASDCDSVATLVLTINNTTTSTTSVTRCSNQLPYLWNGTNYNASGTYTFTTTNAAGCDSVATLVLTINNATTSTTNVTRCSNQLPYLWNGTNYNASGTYTFTTTNAAGCDSVATLMLTINNTASSITNITRCSNQLPYLWNGTNYNAAGTYTFTTTNAAGCDSVATLVLTINNTATSITNVTRCSNQLPYNWNGTDYNASGIYTFATVSAAGCDSVATLVLTVSNTVTSTTNVTRCSNQLPYLWNGTNYNAGGTYTFTSINAGGCDSIATLVLTISNTVTSTTNVTRCSSQLPYLWNGTNYNAGGTYTFNTTNAAGCDSVATLVLTINNTTTSTTNVTRCSNQLPYLWNGTNYNAGGTYTFTTTNAAGCDSVATLVLTISNTTTSTTNVSRCSNQLPYLWNGTNYNAGGTYTFTTTNGAGCDSVATLVLTINNTATSITNVTRCFNQLPYLWNGTNYNASGTYTFATVSAAGCDSVATLVLTVSNTVTSTTNVTRCSNQLPYLWNGTNYNAGGTYIFTTTSTAGCDSVATLVLTVSNTVTSTTNVTRCSSQLPYLWNGTNYNASGTYTFTTTNSAGCDSVATLVLTINNTTTSTTNVSRCSNQLPYNWNGTDYSVSGTYTFTTTNATGCDSVATLVLIINNTTSSTTNVSRCSSQLPYNWNGTDYNASGTYLFSTTGSTGCDSVATLVLTISNTVTSTTNITRCASQLPYFWNGINYNAAGVYTFTTTSVAGCDSVATLVLAINNTSTSITNVARCINQLPYLWNGTNYNAAGTYTFTTTNAAGCDSVATLMLTINNTTTSTTNVVRCSNQLPYNWNGTNYSSAGTYTFTTINAAGCDSVAILVLAINNTTTSTTSVTRCTNQLPYIWNGIAYNASGTYTFNTVNATGCDSVATLVLTVGNTATSTTNVVRCSSQLPYNWNGTDYNASGTYTFNTVNAAGCDSVATLVLTVSNTVTSSTSITRCASQLPYNWNGTDYNASGTYTFTTTSTAGCDSVATLVLTVNNATTSTTNVTRCSNQLPYNWNGTDYNASGTYTFTTTSTAGCDSVATLVLTVNNATTSTTNVTRCSNQLPYLWNGTNYNTSGTYTFATTNAAGCDSVATLVLTVGNTATSTTTVVRCSSQLPYNWNGTDYNASGTYTFNTVNAAGCDSIATLVLTVSNTVTSTTNVTRCPNQLPYNWNGIDYNAGGTYTFTTTNAAGCDSVATLVLIVNNVTTSTTNVTRCSNQLPYNWNGTNYNAGGTYTFTTTNASGCDSVATLVLSIGNITTSTTNVTRCSNQLPYNWNGTGYNASGTYTFTTTNAAGCDSVATLELTVSNTVTSTTNVTRCSNQLPYNWNGTDYSASGTYTFATTTNAAGCDSVATLVLTIVNAATSTTNVTRCSNQLPYNWNGINYNANGTYTFSTTSSSGCDSVATLVLTINNTATSTTNVTRCSNQLPYIWNGTSYNGGGTYTFATTNTAGCDSVATLVLTVSNSTTSTTSVTRCSNQLPYVWNGTNYNGGGTYTYTTTNASGCDSVATLVLTISNITTSTTNITRCSSQLPYIWNGTNYNGGGTYTYTTTNAAGCDSVATLVLTISNITTSTTNVTRCSNQLPYIWNGTNYNGSGTYTYTTTNAAGCDSVATLVLTISNSTTSVTNVTRCSNQLPYNWNGTNYNASGTYTFTTINAAGCDSVATLVLNIKNTTTSITNVTRCSNQLPYNWNGTNYNASGTYTFTTINAAGCDSVASLVLSIKNTTTSTTNITSCANQLPYNWNGTNYNTSGTYTFATTNAAGCDSIATLNLIVKNLPTATLSGGGTICKGSKINLAVALTGTAPFSITYRDGTNTYTISSIASSPYQIVVTPAATTTYTISSVSDASCTNNAISSSVTVTVIPPIPGVRYPTITTTTNKATPLNARNIGNNYTYQWNPPAGLNTNSIINPVFTYDRTTEYTITLTSDKGCTVTDTLLVKINPVQAPLTEEIYVPKGWSPNNDGHNDKLYPLTENIKELKYFRVFNRWGQMVFETNVIGLGWDGIFKGKAQVMDVYVWTAEAVGVSGTTIKRTGNSVLIR
jgi:gliding motility-associated-like protein